MSWHFLLEQEEASWEGSCLDGAPSALLSLLPTQGPCFWLDSGTDGSRVSQCGTTFGPSTETNGEGTSMSSAEDSLAPTFPWPVTAKESKAPSPDSGKKCAGSLAKFDPDTSSWRTPQLSLLGDLESFSETWPRWGSMRDGECWELTMPAHLTSGKESGFWRTPDTGAGGTSGLLKEGLDYRENGQPIQVRLVDQVNNPRLWPTPISRDWKSGTGADHGDHSPPLSSVVGGQLSPDWTAWLMGWPIGWTRLKPLGTDKFPHNWSWPSGPLEASSE